MENNLEILDLSGQKLTKLNKAQAHEQELTTLILDENDLQRLDNIDSFSKVQKLSIVRNQLIRMYGICRMHNLTTLNLAHNGIITIEGLKDLTLLKCLCLAGNSIKTIEHLHTNINLEHLDLSENNITHISDISYLKNLKELLLHGNRIGHLRQCERYLPSSLITLTLASNNISDLNEISQLQHLINLNNFSITGNPCVCMTGNKVGFDYRPFVINWLMSLKVIDGYVVDAIESLRAEWLYSQGRGRHFRTGDHQELIQYLASVCPPSGETLQTEEERKLRLILSKAQHHQQQLRDQLNANGSRNNSPTPSPNSKRKMSRITPRGKSRIKPKSPDRMTTSCIVDSNSSTQTNTFGGSLMSQSLDPNMLSNNLVNKMTASFSTGDELNGVSEESQLYASSPLQAATKLVPVPESLMSPDFRPPNVIPTQITRVPTPAARIIQQQHHTATVSNRSIPTTVTKRDSPRGSPKLARSTPNASPKQQRSNVLGQKSTALLSSSPLRTRKNLHEKQNGTINHHHHQVVSSVNSTPPNNNSLIHSSDEDSELCESKLSSIRHLAQERRATTTTTTTTNSGINHKIHQQKLSSANKIAINTNSVEKKINMTENDAAIKIQKVWRGFYCRNINKDTKNMLKSIKDSRTRLYIEKLATDMEKAKEALECERKIQVLQMQAINALWQKVSSMQPTNSDSSTTNLDKSSEELLKLNASTFINNELTILSKTYGDLSTKVNNIQESLDEVKNVLRTLCIKNNSCTIDSGTATQTEIVAVHTPQGDAAKMFPYQRTPRPSSLPLPQHRTRIPTATATDVQIHQQSDGNEATDEVHQFVGNLVNDAIRTLNDSDNNVQTVTDDDDESGVILASDSNPEQSIENKEILSSDNDNIENGQNDNIS